MDDYPVERDEDAYELEGVSSKDLEAMRGSGDAEPLMVSVTIALTEAKQAELWIANPLITDPEVARDAVNTVMGSGRAMETEDESVGGYLVQFTKQEYEMLESQGYIELEWGTYVISAEMP